MTKSQAVPSPPMPPIVSSEDIPLRASATTEAPLSPPPMPLPVSTKNVALEISCDEEEELTEIKLKLNPLSRLIKPPIGTNHKPYMHEKYKDIISQVKSLLVDQLTKPESTIDEIVTNANNAFKFLNGLGADCGSFYQDVKDFLTCKYDILIAEREENMLSFPELETKYEEAVIHENDLDENIAHTQEELKRVNEKKEPLKRNIEKATKFIDRQKQEIVAIEQEEERLKHEQQKYKAEYEIAHAEVQKLGTQKDASKGAQRDIEQRKTAALKLIESITRRLQSIH